MGIYIKGLKMPRKGEYHFTLYVFEDGSAILDGATYDEPFEVVEVKEPHGRLMDLDAWLKNNGMLDDCKYCADRNNRISLYEKNYSKCDICNIVDDDRTIVVVEAEGE